jgi:hypothetical protein
MRYCLLVLPILAAPPVAAQEWSVDSPDGRTAIAVTHHDDGRLTWRAMRGSSTVVEESPLGIRRADQEFVDGLKLVDAAAPAMIDERYTMPHGKRREHHVRGRERTLAFANAAGARLDIVLRAHDDGVAWRYRFPDAAQGEKAVLEELTGFAVPRGSTAWLQPQQEPGKYGPAYEEFYEEVRAGDAAPRSDGWAYPALFRTPGGPWLLISESGFDGGYCGTHLAAQAPRAVYRVAFPDREEGLGIGDVQPSSTLPWTLPWRVVIIGDEAGRILESDLIRDLSAPTRLPDTAWIRPGRAAWSWWSESDSPRHAEHLNAFTDLAAEMGWEYALVDANWNRMETGRIEDVVERANEKKVGLLFWYNSGGPHNEVTAEPRDRMHQRDVRRAEFAKLRDWGVQGVKIDFWHSDKQDRYQQYRNLLADAADFELLVNFHGSTIPRGWEREFPHLIGMEAVRGAEQYKFGEYFPANAAWQATVLPFTRNVLGVMDYTPVTFSDHKYARLTTNAHELAQAVVFETGVQHFADSVEAYRGLLDEPKAFLREVPAAWDETRGLVGQPGRMVVVARRDGDTWYVGGLNADTAQSARVNLAFLGSDSWQMTLIRDGAEDRTFDNSTRAVTSAETIEVLMRARGGFVMRLTKSSG